ncbi:MAG: PEP-CTERM sorting domain-containing protein [Candidatus Solibacter usitatus]|nr:PEP-CTERM sorting domain-containing protein [Candidatus Solibacter usitatus]
MRIPVALHGSYSWGFMYGTLLAATWFNAGMLHYYYCTHLHENMGCHDVSAGPFGSSTAVWLPVQFGEWFNFETSLLVSAGGMNGSGFVDASNTFEMGPLQIFDELGNDITGLATVEAMSGHDYMGTPVAPIPEPASAVLTGAGLALCLLRRALSG